MRKKPTQQQQQIMPEACAALLTHHDGSQVTVVTLCTSACLIYLQVEACGPTDGLHLSMHPCVATSTNPTMIQLCLTFPYLRGTPARTLLTSPQKDCGRSGKEPPPWLNNVTVTRRPRVSRMQMVLLQIPGLKGSHC